MEIPVKIKWIIAVLPNIIDRLWLVLCLTEIESTALG